MVWSDVSATVFIQFFISCFNFYVLSFHYFLCKGRPVFLICKRSKNVKDLSNKNLIDDIPFNPAMQNQFSMSVITFGCHQKETELGFSCFFLLLNISFNNFGFIEYSLGMHDMLHVFKSINPLSFDVMVKLELNFKPIIELPLLFLKLRVLFNATFLLIFYINVAFSCMIPLNVSKLVQWNFKKDNQEWKKTKLWRYTSLKLQFLFPFVRHF